uniref:Reverse transcriptase domain-containing protein n=1 Tax=Tanacetum cinerariifolium TaxID=118510 RepID=A0A6L2KX37_TANCI|nr:reverse transcriptase domain-containing protein [Tanacetum cinerariifolium]
MADQRTMAQLLQAPTEGYEDAIVVPAITADNFELKHDQDLLNSAAGGNFLDKMPRECLDIIESNSKVRYSCNNPVFAKVSMNTSTSGISPDVAELKDMVKALLLDKKSQNQAPAIVKAVEESCVTCGGAHSYRNCPATDVNVYRDNIQEFVSQDFAVNYNQGNTSYHPLMMSNQIRPPGFPLVVENEPEMTKDTVTPPNNESTKDVQPSVIPTEFLILNFEPVNSPIIEPVASLVSAPKPNPKSSIPYPSRRNDERNHEKANNQIKKFYQIFQDMSFKISFADTLILKPKFASTLKSLIRNKEKLSEMARTPLNEHCSAVLLKKLPEKTRRPRKVPHTLVSLPELTPTCMTLELADRSISRPIGVTEDIYVKVRKFHFPADFVVVDFDADPRVPIILGRSFRKTRRALIDVFEGNYLPEVRKELEICEAKYDKSSIDEPPEVELKELFLHLKYTFLKGDDKLPVIIANDLSVEEKTALITDDFEPAVQHQRRVNPKMHDVIKQEVIEFGDSYEAPQEVSDTGSASESSTKKKGRTIAVTTEDMQKRRNDVKTKKNQLKQQYGNFKAEGSETLEQTFNRLQAIVSHLEFMDVEIEQDDLNQKFLISLAPEWLMYTIVWRNKSDLDTMSLDDLYNHLKV